MVEFNAFKACKIGDIFTLKKLESVTETLVDDNGASCLHYAARGGSIAVVEYLLKTLKFSIVKRTKTGATPLHDAAARGNTAIVKWLVENCDIDANNQDGAGVTPLHLAALYRHFLTVEWLLDEANADASVRSNSGALPLHFAVVGGDMNCVQILLDENPRLINMQMNNGTTPLYMACQNGHLNILKYLIHRNGATKIKAYDGMSCLHAAAQMGHLDVVKWLMQMDQCNPHERDFDGATPLHFAASRGHADVVRWMMTEGKAKITLDNLGGSPLHSAAQLGELQTIQALRDCGCDVNLTDNDGLTADELADNCDQSEAAALIRGEVTLAQLGHEFSESRDSGHSPHLSFPPPPPFPPEDLDLSHNTRSVSTHTHLPSPPLTWPSPLQAEEEESEGLAYRLDHVQFAASVFDPPGRPFSRISVDSSASNFGVFEQQDGRIEHTVTAEVHKVPKSVPPTPRPASFPSLPGHSSVNTTQESSGSSSSLSQDESDSSLDRKSPKYLPAGNYIYGSHGFILSTQRSQQYPVVPAATVLAAASQDATALPAHIPDSSPSIESPVSPVKRSIDTAEQIAKTQYYFTPFKIDFNTGTKSSFARAKLLFQDRNLQICPDNGEICSTAERGIYSEKSDTHPRMDSSNSTLSSTAESVNHVGNGSLTSSPSVSTSTSSSPQATAKSFINIKSGSVTIISTGGRGKKAENSYEASARNPTEQGRAAPLAGNREDKTPVVAPLKAAHGAVPFQSQRDSLMKELQSRSRNPAQLEDNDSHAPTQKLMNGHGKIGELKPVQTTGAAMRTNMAPTHLTVNGTKSPDSDKSGVITPISRQSSRSFSPIESKHNLIADIQSAVSGTSSLSLRRAKSKGDGVSMVYQSRKSGARAGETQTDSKPLTGDFDPKNFLDKVEKMDATGRVIPEWRRHVLAKHLAEKAQKDFEEQKIADNYEARFRNIPAWKRALIERKEAQAREQETAATGKK